MSRPKGTPEHIKRRNRELEKNQFWVESREIALDMLQTAFKNNKYLLDKHGKTELDQHRELKAHKITLDVQIMRNYRVRSNKWAMSIMPIALLCRYWNKSISELTAYDFEYYEKIK